MHTYKDIVNEVLMRLREDTVTTIGADRLSITDDPVVDIAKLAVNDAKCTVESAHQWNALRTDWTFTTVEGTHTYGLPDSKNRAIIESVYGESGLSLRNVPLRAIHKKAAANSNNGAPFMYAANGTDANGDLAIRLFSTPSSAVEYTVHGFHGTPELNVDSDQLVVPYKPVMYLALALTSRERGETGGAQSMELFSMAKDYLSDAIALDAASNDLDNDWNVS